jgi:succinate dehydrogenase / fumarate reductase, cytochrome b subunit
MKIRKKANSILNSTIFNKVIMAVTGFILLAFITGHAFGNLQLYIGKAAYNTYAHFLQKGIGELIWLIRITMIVSVVLHIYTSVKLKFLNLSAKPAKYQVKNYIKSTIYSRNMIYTGILIFLFLVYHLLHFTIGTIMPSAYGQYENYGVMNLQIRQDVYQMVVLGFSNVWVAISYVLAVSFLGFHLTHSLQSGFQTLGFGGDKFTPVAIYISRITAIVITVMFLAAPFGVLFGLIK